MKKTIQVAVGLVFNSRQEILLAWRDAHKSPGNCWEFPGGKIEAQETGYQALCRELQEEIGIQVKQAKNYPEIFYDYQTLQVILQPWRVYQYEGTPYGLEGQKILWVRLGELREYTLPSANYAIVDLLQSIENPIFSD
jgi:8-oxo-dGTP diphosphatase